jgi:hypothetical protein
MKHIMGSAAMSSWKRLKVVGKMRRQEREAMGRDVLSGIDLIGIVGDSVMIRFSRKRGPSISTTRAIQMQIREPKGGEFKRF